MNNGNCDAEISNDFNCMYDTGDCQDTKKQTEMCQYAMEQSKLSCEIKTKVCTFVLRSSKYYLSFLSKIIFLASRWLVSIAFVLT